jgi:hypothetical protein
MVIALPACWFSDSRKGRHQSLYARGVKDRIPFEREIGIPAPALATPPRKGMSQMHSVPFASTLPACACGSKTQRAPITLPELCGLSHAEIAERMHKSEGAVRSLVYCGPCRLR